MSDYYIKTKGEERGPYAEGQLRSMWGSGAITSDTLFRTNESQDWQPIGRLLDAGKAVVPAGKAQTPTATASPGTPPPQKSQAGTAVVLVIVLLVIAAMFFGNVHVISGGSLDSPRIVRKESFGFSETFIKIDSITGMPWISARSRHPLSCAVLERERLIESDEEFRGRRDKKMKEEMEKALKDLTK